MKKKEIYVPIYEYMITYIEIENYTEKEIERVTKTLKSCKIDDENISDVKDRMKRNYNGGATTFSSEKRCELVVLVYPHSSQSRKLSTIMHEKRHCEDFILNRLDIDDMEAAAYLAGWLAVEFSNIKSNKK